MLLPHSFDRLRMTLTHRFTLNDFRLLLERRGATEQTVRISGFVEIDGEGLCEKRRPENGVCLAR